MRITSSRYSSRLRAPRRRPRRLPACPPTRERLQRVARSARWRAGEDGEGAVIRLDAGVLQPGRRMRDAGAVLPQRARRAGVATGSLTRARQRDAAPGCRAPTARLCCTLAALPSTSSARCCTGRPRRPPRLLMSCQAARAPMTKSLADVLLGWREVVDRAAPMVIGRGGRAAGREAGARATSTAAPPSRASRPAAQGWHGHGKRKGAPGSCRAQVQEMRPSLWQ